MAEAVRITNPDKMLYPATGFTKAQVVEYYGAVADVLVAHLRGRALTLRRYPDGVGSESFFEKRCPAHAPDWVPTVEVARSGGPPYLACSVDNSETLRWVANLAALELHPSLALGKDPERPTTMVFDLDPGAPAGVPQCAEVALALRDVLARLELASCVKTSGSKGLQLYVPLNTPIGFDTTKLLSHTIGMILEKQLRPLVVTTMAKQERPGKVFIDWSQNDRAKTTVSVYSLRARPEPSVSTPLSWKEVESVVGTRGDVLRFGPEHVVGRLKVHGDLFSDVIELRQTLPESVSQLLSAPAP